MSQPEESIVRRVREAEYFSAFDEQDITRIAQVCEVRPFGFGDTVFSEGDAGEGLFVIHRGAVRLFGSESGKERSIGVRGEGEVFAELASLRPVAHEYSARASSADVELLYIPRDTIAELLQHNPDARKFVESFVAISSLGGVVSRLFNIGKRLDHDKLRQLVGTIGVKRFAEGEIIVEQGDIEDRRLYIVRSGAVRLSAEVEGVTLPLGLFEQSGFVVGEKPALNPEPHPVTVAADGEALLLVVPSDTLQELLAANDQLAEALRQKAVQLDKEIEQQFAQHKRRNRPLSIDLFSSAKPGENVISGFKWVEQAEEMDCGAACLAMVSRHYGINLSMQKLRDLANVTAEGASLRSLAKTGETLGFTTRSLRCNYNSLVGLKLPLIAHWQGYHWIVVYGVSKSKVWVADPASGLKQYPREEFEAAWTGTCVTFEPSHELARGDDVSPWYRFLDYVLPYRKIMAYLLFATFVIQLLGVIPPILIQNILDQVIVQADVALLNVLIFGFVITQLFVQLTDLFRSYLGMFLARNLDFKSTSGFLRHVLALPVSFFAKRKTGDILARFGENQTILGFLTSSTISTLLNVLMIFVYATVLFFYSVSMTTLLLVMVIPVIVLTFAVTPKIKAYARETFDTSTKSESTLMEILGGAETVKAMGLEDAMRKKWEREYVEALGVEYRAERFGLGVGFVNQLLNALITIVILWTGANLVIANELTIGQLMAFNALMGSLLSPLFGLVGLWDEVQEAGVAMERLGDVLDTDLEQAAGSAASRVALTQLEGHIELRDVYFKYGGEESPYILERINLQIEPGQLVAIVGESGSGKSTLAKLLVGFYEPSEGQLLVDGHDLSVIDRFTYRASIGYVMQSNLLFSGTVIENIAAGEEDPDPERVRQAAMLADAHNFIQKLPLGYEQIVGERGTGLSGGQMQRLCIARALYRDPRLLIFDEATSALDTKSEANILANMRDITQGRTAVVIAHRLSTIREADQILVLYDGRIAESGVHDELLAKQGMYYELVRKQLGD